MRPILQDVPPPYYIFMRLTQIPSAAIAVFVIPIGWMAHVSSVSHQNSPKLESAETSAIVAAFTPVPNEPPTGTHGSGTR
jgi:hypothetical protein